jgi:putative membrane protein
MTLSRLAALAGTAGVLMLAAPALPAQAQSVSPTANNAKPGSALNTNVFLGKAVTANQFEIESSKIAVQKARNEDVKRFAQQMIDDHTKAGQDLQAAVQQAGVEMPAPLDGPQHAAIVERIGKASNVDAEYVQAQLKAHQDAVRLFQTYSNGADNGPIQQFASNTLPTLQMHLQHVEQLARSQARKTSAR